VEALELLGALPPKVNPLSPRLSIVATVGILPPRPTRFAFLSISCTSAARASRLIPGRLPWISRPAFLAWAIQAMPVELVGCSGITSKASIPFCISGATGTREAASIAASSCFASGTRPRDFSQLPTGASWMSWSAGVPRDIPALKYCSSDRDAASNRMRLLNSSRKPAFGTLQSSQDSDESFAILSGLIPSESATACQTLTYGIANQKGQSILETATDSTPSSAAFDEDTRQAGEGFPLFGWPA
jgi:hypothetical protein